MKNALLLFFLIQSSCLLAQSPALQVQQFPEQRFEGGAQAFYSLISQTLLYPIEARQAGRKGTAIVALTVETDGTYENIEFLNPLGYGIEEAKENAFESVENNWLPDTTHLTHTLKMLFLISFNIEGIIALRTPYDQRHFMEEISVVGYGERPPNLRREKLIEKMYKHFEKENFKKALFYINELIRQDPFEKSWHLNRATIYANLGQNDQVCDTLYKLQEILSVKITDELKAQYCHES